MPFAILAILANGVEANPHRQYSGCHRNLFAFEPVRITAAVPSLVMMANDRYYWIREVDAFHNLGADDRVNLHLLELGGGKFAGFVQYVIRYGYLADVVQQRARFERFNFEFAKSEVTRKPGSVDLNSIDVIVCDLILASIAMASASTVAR